MDGQVAVAGSPAAATNVVPNKYAGTLKAYVTLLNLNAAAPIDLTTITVGSLLYVPILAMVYNPTANLSGASLGIYTAPAAGGVTVVTPVGLASLTGVGTYQALAIAALAGPVTSNLLYPRLTVASGVAGTASLVVEYMELSLI